MMMPAILIASVDDRVVLHEWLKPQVAIYATAEMPERWTAVNTLSSGTSAHAMAWTGDIPLMPNGFESDHLAHRLKLVARTSAWALKR